MNILSSIVTLFLITITVNAKLEQVVSFFRHGARFPLNSYYDGK